MIKFNDGKTSEAYPYFSGTVCTIYDTEPNTNGFSYDGMDFSDFNTLYRQGENYYQLSNNGSVCNNENEPVLSKEEIEQIFSDIDKGKQVRNLESAIQEKKDKLASTDYIIIKQMEGLDMSEYDLDQIKIDRQTLRNEINALEDELSVITES